MDFLKKLILFFSFSFGTFCNEDDNDDDDDYEEVEIVKKKKINKKNKPKSKKSKGRSGIIHTLTDKIHMCTDFYIINGPYLAEKNIIKDIEKLATNTPDFSKCCLTYLCPSAFIGYNFDNSRGVSLKIGVANILQTQISRYKFKAAIIYRRNLNLLLSLGILFEGGIGYCFGSGDDKRIFKSDNNNSSNGQKLSSFFNTKVDQLIFCANIGVKFLFFSIHLGGEVSLSKLLSKRNNNHVSSTYKEVFDKYISTKGRSYIDDMTIISVRIYPFKIVDYFIGWLI